jgi:alpha-galactosidase/6-phospho-beta-glucosidase family protein
VFRVFRIDCTSSLEAVTFIDDYMTFSVELLVVHCSAGGLSLQISGLEHLGFLKEVWLKGSYSHQLWQQLKQQLSKHPRTPVLKPERPHFVLNNGC